MAQHMSSQSSSQVLLEVRDSSAVAEARRIAGRLASGEEFNDVGRGNVALVATELATNLIKHAEHGRMIMRVLDDGQNAAVEIMALDRGPGIRDLAQSMCDGYSSAGSPGTGFGAIKRLATKFDVHSLPGKGTAVLARISSARLRQQGAPAMESGVVCLPFPGEEVSGDAWGIEETRDKYTCMVVDGLGHGRDAAAAAQAALAIVEEHRDRAPAEIIERAHAALRSTRGAACAVAEINSAQRLVRFCGIGNIVATIVMQEATRHMVSLNGIVGQQARKIAEFTYPWHDDAVLIMHSDGLATRWDLRSYPGLSQRHPSLIAGVLCRDFSRGRDDMVVLAVRENERISN
jgi:anti-sigma regulatory factor (Ser/Thr protein kinase)